MRTNIKARMTEPAEDPADTCEIPCFNGALVRTLQGKMPGSELAEDVSRLFGALSDPTRLKLLVALDQASELCVCDLAHVVGTTISTASHHLRKLRDLGLLNHRNDGRMSYYAIRNRTMARMASAMLSAPAG